jgi:Domain of unknown function (DUF4390)
MPETPPPLPRLTSIAVWRGLKLWMVSVVLGWACALASAPGVELATLQLNRQDGQLTLDFSAKITLPRTVEDALQRGVPVYFVAQAEVFRSRWYWRDERVARVARSWRIAYQPLTATWRLSLGGLNQSYATLPETLMAISRISNWKLAELSQLESGNYVEFSYRLDNTQLPSPMQIGLGGPAGWALGVERTLKIE